MTNLTRGRVAERAGVNGETLRYYEQRGLIPPPRRTKAGYRIYSDDDVDRIRFIKRAQELGFSLAEIDAMLRLQVEPGADMQSIRQIAETKIADIEARIRDLTRMRDALVALTDACCGHGPVEECPILEALREGGPDAG